MMDYSDRQIRKVNFLKFFSVYVPCCVDLIRLMKYEYWSRIII